MDVNLKQWREELQESEEEQQQPYAKIPRQHLLPESFDYHQSQEAAALPFVHSEPHDNKIITTTTTQSSSYSDGSTSPTVISLSSPRFPRWGGYCFSIAQWQELELQASIFRHMIAGATVPPELLQMVKKKSLLTSSSSPYYLHHYSPHLHQAALLQGGYWGKGAMDPEPGRCRRTDGKKWRCSRDVMAGHKYCERHVHRGRNRSRKPVEFPSSTSASGGSGGGVSHLNKTSATTFAAGSGGGGIPFSLSASGAAASYDVLRLNQGSSSDLSRQGQQHSAGGEKSNNSKVLMQFLNDWPRSLQQSNNAGSNCRGNSPSMSLSMSTPRNQMSDFLRLSTGNGDEVGSRGSNGNQERERTQGWIGGGWGGGQLGGPLGEALRSSTTNSSHSPTSVLH